MNEINLDAHYTTNPKVNPIRHEVATPPVYIKPAKLINDKELDKKVHKINKDVYVDTKKEKNKSLRNLGLLTIGTVFVIFAAKMISKIFKPL